jgi:hypothetical protein
MLEFIVCLLLVNRSLCAGKHGDTVKPRQAERAVKAFVGMCFLQLVLDVAAPVVAAGAVAGATVRVVML